MAERNYGVRLSEGFSLRDVTGEGAHFTVMPSNEKEAELEQGYGAFDGDAHLANYRADVLETDSEKFKSPFERHRSLMENVTNDGAVKKRIVRTGADIVVPPNAFVTFHYNAYMEYNDEPFDSSVLQGKPCVVKLNTGALLPGLEIGLRTMRRSEKADILVQSHMAYGPRGCPPRIPPNSEVLFDVELLNWSGTPDAEIIEAIDKAHLSSTDWEKSKTEAKRLNSEGKQAFNTGKYQKALRAYKSAEKVVAATKLKDEMEEKEYNFFLRKFHTNMAICYNELKRYNDVCIHCREAIMLEPNHAKAHYHWGLALTALNEFSSARDHLKKAKSQMPNDKSINNALNRLEERVREASKLEKMMWRRAINPTEKPEKPEKKEQNQDIQTASPWKNQLTAFKETASEKRMLLPGGMDNDELDAVCADVQALNLKINITSENVCVFKNE